jgi:hypothetical protein
LDEFPTLMSLISSAFLEEGILATGGDNNLGHAKDDFIAVFLATFE